MGWTFMPSRGREGIDIIRELLTCDNDRYSEKVIDHAAVGSTIYLLLERTPKGAWEPNSIYLNDPDGTFRWIAVFLTRVARDAYDFGYKDMEESMGPVESRCPLRLIAGASKLRNDDPVVDGNYAAQWRARCRDYRARQNQKAKLAPGAVVRLAHPVKFTDGYEGDLFTVLTIRHRRRNKRVFKAVNGRLYRIANIDAIGYSIETAKPSESMPGAEMCPAGGDP